MKQQKMTSTNLEILLDQLASNDGMIRQRARKSIVAVGRPAVSSLVQKLQNSKMDQVRWEAAKALGEIRDIRSIAPLVRALEDSNHDVSWLAAEALKRFGKTAWRPLLRALIKNGADSVLLRQGAHHILSNQKEDGFNDLLKILMEALKSGAVSESTPVAAYEILKRMEANL